MDAEATDNAPDTVAVQRDLRKAGCGAAREGSGIVFRLNYRPPYQFRALLAFFRDRALEGVEVVDETSYARTVRLVLNDEKDVRGWIRITNDEVRCALAVEMSESLVSVTSQVMARVRRQFDVDCDPQAIYEGIRSLDIVVPGAAVRGTRLPGCFDSFETAARAVLGQQVSVKAANKLAARMVAAYGQPIETGIEGLTHAFPTPHEMLALDPIEDALGVLGVIKTRSRTIAELARRLEAGTLDLSDHALVSDQMERLLDIKGIGPWSAHYLAMRTMCYPDAFLETDVGIKHALPQYEPKQRLALAERWRPWRSYATMCLWNSLAE